MAKPRMRNTIPTLRALAATAASKGDNALRTRYAALLADAMAAKASFMKAERSMKTIDRFEFLSAIGMGYDRDFGFYAEAN